MDNAKSRLVNCTRYTYRYMYKCFENISNPLDAMNQKKNKIKKYNYIFIKNEY
jgi:hypothetical protein